MKHRNSFTIDCINHIPFLDFEVYYRKIINEIRERNKKHKLNNNQFEQHMTL